MEKETFHYTWSDGERFSFMNSTTFEEVQLNKEDISDWEFLVEGQEVKILKFHDQLIGVDLPKTYDYEVLKIDPQRTSAGFQAAIIGSGAEIYVPIFINPGMKIKVNVHEKTYLEKSAV